MSAIHEHYHTCKKYINKRVRIMTISGASYEGRIVKVDGNRVYLQTGSNNRNKATVSFLPFILPLVLFDLLAIVLIDRPFRRCFC
ncbi:hypothetical protein [Paenibacillus elgii]|uniref:Uncharacterized protein n=1 Tax=Paenibacillus elgii TaxID=189691 RepID=A0A165Q1Y7_9BACL|nr:hypothetical protein [Paenibacillus elgii]KZE73379.1 hypothetical protein AV654_32395 [Paenibacillus elgii]MCM3273556.1 hypothetical protein [Paenibacillus elgii]NEN82640.1 hypothetical protein [Paenibacillus elgii]PUA39816.1 hypothetical protein C8Z91_07010 [Paenibacillus elgii]